MIYRDANTGKVWEMFGGQEPREIDPKLMNIDINSIPVVGNKESKKVICPNCGSAVPESTFCPVCGEKLKNE